MSSMSPPLANSFVLGTAVINTHVGFGIGFTLLLTLSFTRSSPSHHPPFTQYPSPLCSLVHDGQTSPHKPLLVLPHSTCPSLSPSPPAHSFIIGPAGIRFNWTLSCVRACVLACERATVRVFALAHQLQLLFPGGSGDFDCQPFALPQRCCVGGIRVVLHGEIFHSNLVIVSMGV